MERPKAKLDKEEYQSIFWLKFIAIERSLKIERINGLRFTIV